MKLRIASAIWKSICEFMMAGSIVETSPSRASLYVFLPPGLLATAAAGAGRRARRSGRGGR